MLSIPLQVKSTTIEHNFKQPPIPLYEPKPRQFKPLIEVDPTIKLCTNRLQNPRPGDYSLQKIASTEGIASKKSLELKKRYLLGETQGTGVLKSDSASALDQKLRSFQTNITECQKLLNPAPDLSTAMKTFLTNTNKLTESLMSRSKGEESLSHKIDEKENVNDVNVSTKNEINLKNDIIKPRPDEYIHVEARKVNIEIIDLDKEDDEEDDDDDDNKDGVIDLTTPQNSPLNTDNKYRGNILPQHKDLHNLYIDLTNDSPARDRSLVETKVNFCVDNQDKKLSPVMPDILSTHNLKNVQECSDKEINNIQTKNVLHVEENDDDRAESPLHETSIEVPIIPWRPKTISDMESDSLSESTTSSIEDIPHFTLDSTTSPETQQCERFIPTLEVRNESGEVMQIDSLMIINGEYIGYPDDENDFEGVIENVSCKGKL